MPVRMLTGSKARASDEPPPPGTAGQALGPMMAMVLIFAGSSGSRRPSFLSSVML